MDDALTLSRWLSPGFPIGAFAWSHGLEAAIAGERVIDADSLLAWLVDLLEHGSFRSDALLVAAAWHQETSLKDIDAEARAFTAASERLEETVEQGAAFCRTLRDSGGPALPDLTYPVALGAASRAAGIDLNLTLPLFLQSLASNLVSAAIRLSVIGQTDGQRILTDLQPTISNTVGSVAGGNLEGLSSTTFLSDIVAMDHETLAPRLFRS